MSKDTGTILVVDDNAANRNLLTRRLEWEGHTIDNAANGQEALDELHIRPYDLILLDIMMPGMNGYEVLEKIKGDDALRHIPVIMITALDSMDSVVKCVELGAEDYLSKPFNPSLLRARVSASLEKKRLHDQEQAYLQETSIMQSIDGELNATLELGRVLSITLNWSIYRSESVLGVIGLLTDGKITHFHQEGANGKLTAEQIGNLPAVQHLFENRQTKQWVDATAAPNAFINADNAVQAIVPIIRQNELIGFILLEKPALPGISDNILSFLTRVSDHAAIAIINAQLHQSVQAANQAKSEFVSLVSHELKVPMTSIKGYADLMLSEAAGPVTDNQGKFLKTIRSNVNRMATLVNDLSDISRIESGRLKLDLEAVSMAEAVEDALQSTKSQMDEREQHLELNIADDLPAVWADPNRTGQILINLLSNAYKYNNVGGGICVVAELADNKWGDEGAPQVVHVAVSDTGIGMSEEDLAQLFVQFFRSENPEVRKESGTGLGLNITKLLIELQGGVIWVESELGKGTTFHFTIPVADEERLASPEN